MKDNKITQSGEKKRKKTSLRSILIFTSPPILLALYVGFFVMLVPVLYRGVLSFIDFVLLDINSIISILRDISVVLAFVFTVAVFVILHYILLGLLVTSLYFMCKELQNSNTVAYDYENEALKA